MSCQQGKKEVEPLPRDFSRVLGYAARRASVWCVSLARVVPKWLKTPKSWCEWGEQGLKCGSTSFTPPDSFRASNNRRIQNSGVFDMKRVPLLATITEVRTTTKLNSFCTFSFCCWIIKKVSSLLVLTRTCLVHASEEFDTVATRGSLNDQPASDFYIKRRLSPCRSYRTLIGCWRTELRRIRPMGGRGYVGGAKVEELT